MSIFSILNLVPLWFIIISLCFYLSKLLFSGFLQIKGNFVRGQNNSRIHRLSSFNTQVNLLLHNNFIVSRSSKFAFTNTFSGDSVTFQCYLSRGNTSRLHVTWYAKGGSNNQEKLISSHNDSFAFTIQGTLADSMESQMVLYRCSVRNADGLGSSPSAKLVILRKGN